MNWQSVLQERKELTLKERELVERLKELEKELAHVRERLVDNESRLREEACQIKRSPPIVKKSVVSEPMSTICKKKEKPKLSKGNKLLIDHIRSKKAEAITPQWIIDTFGVTRSNASVRIDRAIKAGILERVHLGVYQLKMKNPG